MYPMYLVPYHTKSYQNRIPDHVYGRGLPVASCELRIANCQLSPMEAKCYVNDVNVLEERTSCLESDEGVENVKGSREGMRG